VIFVVDFLVFAESAPALCCRGTMAPWPQRGPANGHGWGERPVNRGHMRNRQTRAKERTRAPSPGPSHFQQKSDAVGGLEAYRHLRPVCAPSLAAFRLVKGVCALWRMPMFGVCTTYLSRRRRFGVATSA
jgi:hypothetical protein